MGGCWHLGTGPALLGLAESPTAQADLEGGGWGLPPVGSGPAEGTSFRCLLPLPPPQPPALVLAPGKSREGLCLGPLCPS